MLMSMLTDVATNGMVLINKIRSIQARNIAAQPLRTIRTETIIESDTKDKTYSQR